MHQERERPESAQPRPERRVHREHGRYAEIDWDRCIDEDWRRASFYNIPAGDIPAGEAAPPPDPFRSCLCQHLEEFPAGPPPYREDERYGPLANNALGDENFRKDRAVWYELMTGHTLLGTLHEQYSCVMLSRVAIVWTTHVQGAHQISEREVFIYYYVCDLCADCVRGR
jgi:hypothetical protein